MMGHVDLSGSYLSGRIAVMQTKAVIRAAINVQKLTDWSKTGIMIPALMQKLKIC